jgi:hypothetical protein
MLPIDLSFAQVKLCKSKFTHKGTITRVFMSNESFSINRNNGIPRAQCSAKVVCRALGSGLAIRLPILYICQQAATQAALLLYQA